jgi:adenylate cyclase
MPPAATPMPEPRLRTFDDQLGHRVIETHIWAVSEGLRGASAYELFDGYCQRQVINGVQLWRGQTAMETLHPQWKGYGYTWRRDLNAIQPEQYAHRAHEESGWLTSPFHHLIERARGGECNPWLRRRLETDAEQRVE